MLHGLRLVALAIVLSATVNPVELAAQTEVATFVGTKTCKKCHIKEFRSWEQTKMGEAFESLKPGVDAEFKSSIGLDPSKDYSAEPGCLVCHVTGYMQPGGFVSMEETPDQAGVGCEMCHGAGSLYTQEQHMSLKNKHYKKSELVAVGLVDKVGEPQCVVCHNLAVPIPNYSFNYEDVHGEGKHEFFPLKYDHQ